MKFMYNGQVYNPVNVEKKLKKLGITMNDIEIIPEEKNENVEVRDIQLFRFKNIITGETITSIYDNLDNLRDIVNVNDYNEL